MTTVCLKQGGLDEIDAMNPRMNGTGPSNWLDNQPGYQGPTQTPPYGGLAAYVMGNPPTPSTSSPFDVTGSNYAPNTLDRTRKGPFYAPLPFPASNTFYLNRPFPTPAAPGSLDGYSPFIPPTPAVPRDLASDFTTTAHSNIRGERHVRFAPQTPHSVSGFSDTQIATLRKALTKKGIDLDDDPDEEEW